MKMRLMLTLMIALPLVCSSALADQSKPNSSSNKQSQTTRSQPDNGAVVLGGIAALLLAWGLSEGYEKSQQDDCMKSCKLNRGRCIELCTR